MKTLWNGQFQGTMAPTCSHAQAVARGRHAQAVQGEGMHLGLASGRHAQAVARGSHAQAVARGRHEYGGQGQGWGGGGNGGGARG